MKKRNIKLVLLLELLFLFFTFMMLYCTSFGYSNKEGLSFYWDSISFMALLLIVIPFMCMLGEWPDFWKSLSVGQKEYKLLELKKILEAVKTCQKLVLLGGLFAVIINYIAAMADVAEFYAYGVVMVIVALPGFYALILEFFLLPLSVNTQKAINEEMELNEEE